VLRPVKLRTPVRSTHSSVMPISTTPREMEFQQGKFE